jgi:hypothetical protein
MHPTLLKLIGTALNNLDLELQSAVAAASRGTTRQQQQQQQRQQGTHGLVSVEVFCACAADSAVPLSEAEAFMLAHLLTRRRPAGGGGDGGIGASINNNQVQPRRQQQQQAEGGDNTVAFVDVALLGRIKAGDFLHAAL